MPLFGVDYMPVRGSLVSTLRRMFGVGLPEILIFCVIVGGVAWLLIRRDAR